MTGKEGLEIITQEMIAQEVIGQERIDQEAPCNNSIIWRGKSEVSRRCEEEEEPEQMKKACKSGSCSEATVEGRTFSICCCDKNMQVSFSMQSFISTGNVFVGAMMGEFTVDLVHFFFS